MGWAGARGLVVGADERDAPLHGATTLQALERCLNLGFRLRGRASRSEYWWWMLAHAGILIVLLGVVPAAFGFTHQQVAVGLAGPFGQITLVDWSSSAPEGPVPMPVTIATMIAGIWGLITLIPSVTVAVRRLHDANFSGLWLLIGGLPFGAVALILMLAHGSRAEGERFDG